MADLPTMNPNRAFQEATPAAQAPTSPTPQLSTPAAPQSTAVSGSGNPPQGWDAVTYANFKKANPTLEPTPEDTARMLAAGPAGYNANATLQVPTASPTTQQPTQPAPQKQTAQPPTTTLQPGAQGQDVQALQNYLVQQGYLTPGQVSTGPGTYGPQTTAAVAKMQNDLGIRTATGNYGPETQQAVAQKYQNLYASLKGTPAPDQSAAARSIIQTANDQAQNSNDPVFGSLAASTAPIMQSLTQVLNNINNPAMTAVSLQGEYNSLRDQYNLPGMDAQLMNMQRIMNGTVDDIREEITSAGGLATESQVQGIAAARNKTILKQYNSLATQYDAAQQNVQAMMQYAQTDQSNALARQQLTATVTGTLASIQNQMLQMGMTMQNNARSAAQYNITQTGYKAFAQTLTGNPQMQSAYESLLGLAPGTLSNPTSLDKLDTYKQQQLDLTNMLRNVQLYNAGLPTNLSNTNTSTGQYGTATSTVAKLTGYDPNMSITQVDPSTLASAIIKNEGSSPAGVVNNPGNIKFVGLPGQIDSGVKAADGGTFASYKTPEAGQQAIVSNISSAIQKNPNQTLGAFIDRYTNTAPTNENNLPTPLPTPPGQVGITPVDASTLVRPSWVSNGVPLTMSADDMTSYMQTQKAAQVDPGTHNVIAPGVGYYLQQSDGSYVLKAALPTPIDSQYNQIKQTIASAGQFTGSPTVTRKWTLSANSAIASFKDTGTYKIASNVAPYLAAIHAAAVNPGDKSISDFELLDSFVKAAKGGTGQVTDSQINVMLQGASVGDRYDKVQQKLQQGGVLSTAQRQALVSLADETYKRNLEDYQKGYVQAVQTMKNQGIPPQFWGNLPDFTSLEPTI